MATTIIIGSTSNRLRFLLGVTGLTNSTTGLIISTITDNEATATVYTAAASNIETITTLGTYAAPTASKCRFKEVDATNHPGLYEIQLADARFSVSNASRLVVSVVGAAGLPSSGVHYEVDLKADADVKTWRGTQPNTLQSGRVDSYVGVNNDKTGYSLTQSFPTNFASLAISAGGVVDADVKLWRGTQPNILQSGRVDAYAGAFVSGAIPDTESIADAVWDEATSGHTIAGTYGKLVTTVDTKIDTIDDFVDTEVAAIKAKTDQLNFTIAGQVDANALTGGGGGGLDAAGVRAAVGLASANLDTQLSAIDDFLDTEIAAIKAKTDQLAFTVPNQVDANALTGGGGLTQAQVRQAVGLASANLDTQLAGINTNIDSISVPTVIGTVVTRNQQTTLTAFVGETYTFTIATVDADGNAVDCSAFALEVVIEQLDRTDLVVIPNGSISKTSTTVAFAVSSTYHASEAQYRWALRRTDTNVVIMHGPYVVSYAADN